MITPLTVKGIVYGAGAPKIIVPIVERKKADIIAKAEQIAALPVHMVEWRADFYEEVEDIPAVLDALALLRQALPATPLLFTFRSGREGGALPLTQRLGAAQEECFYEQLCLAAAASGQVDLVDVEVFFDPVLTQRLIPAIHAAGTLVIGSNHDFQATPPQAELVSRLRRMQEVGADIPKLAVMPTCTADVLALLAATSEMHERYADRPIITMSMAPLGVVSRLSGEVFGSALTFGAVGQVSAPGQIPVAKLQAVLDILHQSL